MVNAFDFVIIVLSIALTVVVFVLPDLLLSAKEGLSLVPLTRAAKVARLLRVVLIMTNAALALATSEQDGWICCAGRKGV